MYDAYIIQPLITAHFSFITAHFVHHCTLKQALIRMNQLPMQG